MAPRAAAPADQDAPADAGAGSSDEFLELRALIVGPERADIDGLRAIAVLAAATPALLEELRAALPNPGQPV